MNQFNVPWAEMFEQFLSWPATIKLDTVNYCNCISNDKKVSFSII